MSEHEISRWLDHTDRQMRHGDIQGAISSLRRALSLDPDHAEAHALLAICLCNQKRLHAAEYEAGRAIALEPELLIAHYAMAVVMIWKRKFRVAEEHIKLCLDRDPRNVQYILMLVRLNVLSQKNKNVLPLLDQAREINPDEPDIWSEYADYYWSRGDLDKAHECAQRALQIQPEHVASLVIMGQVLLRRNRLKEARQHMSWALRIDPENRSALALLAAIKMRQSLLWGLWWKFNTYVSSRGMTRMVLILLFMFASYRAGSMVLTDMGQAQAAEGLKYAWYALCLYTWIGPTYFERLLKKELDQVRIDSNY